jgi:hypothetical protein
VAPVLRIGPLRWLTAELIPLSCLAIGAAITWARPDYALAGLMIGVIAAPVLGRRRCRRERRALDTPSPEDMNTV